MSIRHALLALLSKEPKHGLLLQQEFEDQTGEVWPLNVGQVYITLQRLERAGLVASEDEEGAGPRKRFMITSSGTEELEEWLRTPSTDIPPPRDELLIKVLISLRVPGANVHEIVQLHRRHIMELMQRFWRLKAEAAVDDLGMALIADAEMFRLEGIIRWLDAADIRLKRHMEALSARGGTTSFQPPETTETPVGQPLFHPTETPETPVGIPPFQPAPESEAGSQAAAAPEPPTRRPPEVEKQ